MKKQLYLLFLLFPTLLFGLQEKEQKLKEAVLLSNQGKDEEALQILKRLAEEEPQDQRIFLSLGFIYKTLGKIDEAIASFEKANQIKPSENAFYSLALLYEAQAIQAEKKSKEQFQCYQKALSAWESFLKQNPKEVRKTDTAWRHIKHIKEELQSFSKE